MLLNDYSHAVSREKTRGNEEGMPNNNDDGSCQNLKTEVPESTEMSDTLDKERTMSNGKSSVPSDSALPDATESKGFKRSFDNGELDVDNKRSRTVIIDSDDETHEVGDVSNSLASNITKIEDRSVLQENGGDSVVGGSHHSKHLYGNFHCTACTKVAIEVHCHPLLRVIVCGDCKCLIERKMCVKVWTVLNICYCQ